MKSKKLLRLGALALVLGAASSVPAATITNELVVHLPFDNSYDNLAPSTVVASPVNAVTFGGGRVGPGAMQFSSDPTNSVFNYVTLGNPPELSFGGSVDLSVALWVKFTRWKGDPSFISNKNWDSGGNAGWVLATAGNGGYQWNYTDGGGRKDYDGDASTLSDGNWHHIAVVFDRDGNATTFLDGSVVSTQFIGPGGETLDSGLPTNIGQDGTGGYVDSGRVGIDDGMIDDVAIWRRALTPFEMQRVYQFGTNGVKVSDIPDPAASTLAGTIPPNGATDVRTDSIVSADIVDGAAPLDTGTVELSLNGTVVAPAFSKAGNVTTVAYQPAETFANGTNITAQLKFNNGASLVTTQWTFAVVKSSQLNGITGHWDFDAGDLNATIGEALEYQGGSGGVTGAGTSFGTTASFGIPRIQGKDARVMSTRRATDSTIGYVMKHGARPNGDVAATKVNRWTMIMDVLIPTDGWHSFIQTDNTGDGDLFVNPGNGIGISGSYQGSIVRGQWHRVAFAVDMTQSVISKFIDGVKVSDQTAGGLNGRWGLLPTSILFGDEDGESQACFVNSIQIRNYKMSDEGVAALGGPTADGVPLVSGQWDFEAGNLAATIGMDIALRPDTEFVTVFESIPMEGGGGLVNGNVMRFDYPTVEAGRVPLGYILPHGILPNGGGEKVNQYTLIMDIMFPAASTGFRSLLQTQTNNADDGDIFLNGDNGLGISGQYQGDVTPDTFHRVAITVDLTKRELGKYIDGVNVVAGPVGSAPLGTGRFHYLSASSGGVDQRWALESLALLFSDEDGETAAGVVSSIQTRPVVLAPDQIARLGRPTAAGIPVVIPASPELTIEIGVFGAPLIRWSTDVTGYVLEVSTSLAPDAVWTPLDFLIDNSYEEFEVPTPAKFYRLRKQ